MSHKTKSKNSSEQNELAFGIVETRELTRPNITMKHVWACLFVLVLFYLAIGLITIFVPFSLIYKIIFFLGIFILFSEIYLRFFGVILVKCYQHYASDEMRKTCHCVPSCSEYAIVVLKKYPLIFGFIKIYKRLNKTCDGSYKIDKP